MMSTRGYFNPLVRSFGTEERETTCPITAQNQVYDYILFRGSDNKDIRVLNNVPPQALNDPAIMQLSVPPSLGHQQFGGHSVVGHMSVPSMTQYGGAFGGMGMGAMSSGLAPGMGVPNRGLSSKQSELIMPGSTTETVNVIPPHIEPIRPTTNDYSELIYQNWQIVCHFVDDIQFPSLISGLIMEKLDEDFGCREVKDDKSAISERCWRENHRGDSRKWLMMDGQGEILPHRVYSTMKASYSPPEMEHFQDIGKRRALLIKECFEKSYEEAIQNREKPPPVVEYCTEYDGNYHLPGFEPVPEKVLHTQHEELYQKYPLYGSSAMSFWQHKFEHRRVEIQPGKFSGVTDPKNPFKRNSAFSTPITEALCSTEW